jgi:hypothetical protein
VAYFGFHSRASFWASAIWGAFVRPSHSDIASLCPPAAAKFTHMRKNIVLRHTLTPPVYEPEKVLSGGVAVFSKRPYQLQRRGVVIL